MSFEKKFSQQITDFQRYGTYTYKYDEVGNVVFNSSSADFSQVYLALGLSNFAYNDNKVKTFYDPTFVEFIPTAKTTKITTDVENEKLREQLDTEKVKNEELTTQLNSLIEGSKNNPSDMATKQVILELRKAAGQGRVDSDFSEDFPYSPIRKQVNITK